MDHDTPTHACEVHAETGRCPHLDPVPAWIQPAVDVANALVGGFRRIAGFLADPPRQSDYMLVSDG